MKKKRLVPFLIVMICIIVLASVFCWYQMQDKNEPGQNQTEVVSESGKETEDTDGSDVSAPQTPETVIEGTTESGPAETAVEQTIWTTKQVNFREKPDTASEVLCVLPARCELQQTAQTEGWAKVTYEGQSGYVSLDYITNEEVKNTGHSVVIDPGHQSSGESAQEPNGPGSSTMKARVTGGATGTATGVPEYQLNLDIALQLQAELEARGYTVYMTRTTNDVSISNKERAEYASSVGGEISVRIHANGSDDSSVSGALALAPSSSNPYISSLAAESQRLSTCMLDAYCASTGMNNQGVISSDTMTGINWSTIPVTIIEMGYMSNATDDQNMEDTSYQTKMVQGMADGIDTYFAQ